MKYQGIAGSEGIAIGKVYLFKKEDIVIDHKSITLGQVEDELIKLKEAIAKSKKEIQKISEKVHREMGKDKAQIFDAHLLILEDPQLLDRAKSLIAGEKINAASAMERATKEIIALLAEVDDEYIKARIADIEDVGDRLVRNILGVKLKNLGEISEEVIIIAEDVAPSDTALLDKKYVLGIGCEMGSETSHTVIMSKSLDIPAVIGLQDITSIVKDGEMIILDGAEGCMIKNPTEEIIKEYQQKKDKYKKYKKRLEGLVGLPAKTQDGKKVEIFGNIGTPADIKDVLRNGGEGVGLFRTEIFYMNRNTFPTEEEQFAAYREAAKKLGERPLIIRTMDIGGDKNLPYFDLPKEMNPFLGYRAIRICLKNKELFKTQLRAILRAGVFGNISIMFPMISSIEEIREAKEILAEAEQELSKKGMEFDDKIKVGIMVEIPSIAIQAEEAAKEVDFFSIGTNDLCQYTLAVDRMNEYISDLYKPLHPAVLALIKNVIDASHANGIPTGMCGEMASHRMTALILLGMGLDDYSMNASSIPKVKEVIRKTSYKQARDMASDVLDLSTYEEVHEYVERMSVEMGVEK